jgi:putative membrane protein
MLLVHPVHEALRELPLLIAAVVFGSATDNQVSTLVVLWVIVAVGVARWFTTTYRIEPDPESGRLQLRSGVLRRNVLSVPRNRIRSVQTDARLLHRLLGLTVLRVSTGRVASGDRVFELNAVESDQVPRLRAILLARAPQPPTAVAICEAAPEVPLARWRPSWLRYSPLSLSGLVMIGATVGAVYQSGVWAALRDSQLGRSGVDVVGRAGVPAAVVVVLVASVLLAVLRSLLTYGNLVLSRSSGTAGDVLRLSYGLLRVRERSYDMRRLRGGTLRRPLLVRLLGGARLDAAMTGVNGAGESSLLLPPCPAATAESVLTGLVGDAGVVSGPLRGHGPAAARRRWTRAMALPAAAGVGLAAAATTIGVPAWAWPGWAVLTLSCGLLAADRVRALGHSVDEAWLVARTGSLERRRDCIATAGIVGWTVRQSWFQRRAGVATLVAATAAGVKAYRVIDVPEPWAWPVAAQASPWVADSHWAHRGRYGPPASLRPWFDEVMADNTESPRVVSATREIAAGADEIFELIADPSQQPRWDGNDNLAEAPAGQRVRGAGEVFTMTLTMGVVRENHVVEFDEARRIAWLPAEPGRQPPGHLWRWELEPIEGAARTRVTHTYDWSQLTDEKRFSRARATTTEKLMASLDRLAALVERH